MLSQQKKREVVVLHGVEHEMIPLDEPEVKESYSLKNVVIVGLVVIVMCMVIMAEMMV